VEPSVELNATQAALLGFLHDGPATGWDLIEEARHGLARFWNVTASHVYRELKTLEARGLVRAGESGPRDRRPFTVTRSGRREFAAWIRREPAAEQIRIPLLVTLWFGRHLDDETLAGFLDNQRAEHTRRLGEYRAIVEALSESPSDTGHIGAVVEFGIAYESAFVDWLAHLGGGTG
jgi:DNA-binding PadR family transcriptional regulator